MIRQLNSNTSRLRPASHNNYFNSPSPIVSPSHVSVRNNNDNNDDRNLNNNNNHFSKNHTSPLIDSSNQHIIFSSLNVRGINDEAKFSSIIEDLIFSSSSVIGLQETRLADSRGSIYFKNNFSSSHSPYFAY